MEITLAQKSSFKLLNTDRQTIRMRALSYRFKKEINALIKEEIAITKLCYKMAFTDDVRSKAKSLSAGSSTWLRKESDFVFNIGGRSMSMSIKPKFDVEFASFDDAQIDMDDEEKQGLPVPSKRSYNTGPLGEAITDTALIQRFDDFHDRRGKLTVEYKQTSETLKALLVKTNTVKSLKELWPEGEKFWKVIDFEGREIAGLPSVAIKELNEKLGLVA